MDYSDYNDYELLSYICENNEDANDIIFRKYEPYIMKTVYKYADDCKNNGIDKNDLIQEGFLALDRAIHSFDEQKGITFFSFAKTCIDRGIISFIMRNINKKNQSIHNFISIDVLYEDENKLKLDKMLCDKSLNPEKIVIHKDSIKDIIKEIKLVLTDYEIRVFKLKILGFSIKEIANLLDTDVRKINNTLHRLRVKARKVITNLS